MPTKKYDLCWQIPGYDILQTNAQPICESLHYFYDTFQQTLDFKEACFTLLDEVARTGAKLKVQDATFCLPHFSLWSVG